MKTILSIDGGGIRGVIPARFLSALEQRAGEPCWKLFDMIAGTSTGGILALGLTHPSVNINRSDPNAYTAEQLVELYQSHGSTIFNRPPEYLLESGGGMLKAKYPSAGIESVLSQYFGAESLGQALTHVLVTSYDLKLPGPQIFTSWGWAEKLLMHDVARATSAAPTYFPPLDLGAMQLIDGGVFANNPAMFAWVEREGAWLSEPGTPVWDPAEDTLVVSLGTGNIEKPVHPADYGLVEWAPLLVDIFMCGTSDAVDDQMQKACPSYHRFQTDLTGVNQAMDDASPATIAALIKIADDLVNARSKDLDVLVGMLKSR